MMTFSCLAKQEGKLYPEMIQNSNSSLSYADMINTTESSTYVSNDPTDAKILISMMLTLTVGLFQVVFLIYEKISTIDIDSFKKFNNLIIL
jgi:hypothetical protein